MLPPHQFYMSDNFFFFFFTDLFASVQFSPTFFFFLITCNRIFLLSYALSKLTQRTTYVVIWTSSTLDSGSRTRFCFAKWIFTKHDWFDLHFVVNESKTVLLIERLGMNKKNFMFSRCPIRPSLLIKNST